MKYHGNVCLCFITNNKSNAIYINLFSYVLKQERKRCTVIKKKPQNFSKFSVYQDGVMGFVTKMTLVQNLTSIL